MIQVESTHPGEFLISEANGDLSRENVTLLSGQNLASGAVLGKITVGGKYKEFDPAASDGSETAAAILFGEIDASAGDKDAVIIDGLAPVIKSLLVWKTGITDDQKATALAALRVKIIKARES